MLHVVSVETSKLPDTRRPAILPAAIAADLLAEHLAPSWKRTGSLDVVARAEADQSLHHLDRLFAIEAQRFAFFREDPLEDLEGEGDPTALTASHAKAIFDLFSNPDLSLVTSMKTISDQAMAWRLSHGIKPLAWEEGIESARELAIMERGGKLPVAYLAPAFELAARRLERLLAQQAGLPQDVADITTDEIARSVAVELVRAGANAGERLETLASFCLILRPFDGTLVTKFITRGAFIILHALLAAASGRTEGEIRDLCFDGDIDGLETACRTAGLAPGFGAFIIRASKETKHFGPVSTAQDLATFSGHMASWIADIADHDNAPEEVIEAAMTGYDHLDWSADFSVTERGSASEPCAELIQIAAFRR